MMDIHTCRWCWHPSAGEDSSLSTWSVSVWRSHVSDLHRVCQENTGRERRTETRTNTHTHTHRDTHTHTHAHTHTHTETLAHTQRETHTEGDTHRGRHTQTLTHTHTETLTLTHTQRHAHTHTRTRTHTETHRGRHTETLTHTHTHTHTDTYTHTETHTHSNTRTHTRGWTTSDFFKSTFMWWKSSRSRLVADDVINEQSDKRLVHRYEIWHSTAHMTIAPITACFSVIFLTCSFYIRYR